MRIYRGKSRIVGTVRAIATGFKTASTNKKTGKMIQVWFLPLGKIFDSVWFTGEDRNVCGDCPLRAYDADGERQERRCYVNVAKAPNQVGKADDRGNYPDLDLDSFAGRRVRFGAFGDPASIPFRILSKIAEISRGWTGYTHQWRERKNQRFAELVMASVESVADKAKANRLGFRTFRIMVKNDVPLADEVLCPASAEAGSRVQCADCLLCSGTRFGRLRKAKNVAIYEHK